ncbi:UDP binding domain-containing protein [Microbispora sp. NPDC046933]|uniref:UDP binding domain-containing protein n=1 Tax=Microbispora sp. NPDC046933 TaxID=3155618 RepID=UPI0033C377C4
MTGRTRTWEATRQGAKPGEVDPHVDLALVPEGVAIAEASPREIAAADAVVVLTDHDCFDYTMVQHEGAFVFDTRNRCRGPNVERL